MASADVSLVGILLSHISKPSMLVTGKRSALPADDRVGILLNHITPSMTARLARSALGEPRLRPRLVGAGPTSGPPAMAGVLQHKSAAAKADPLSGLTSVWSTRLAWRLRCEFRSAPVEPAGMNGPARAYSDQVDSPPDPQPTRWTPPLGWPWLDPLPAQAPPAHAAGPPNPPAAPAAGGGLVDMVA